MELPLEGTVHTYTTCYFGGEEFLDETPFTLIMVEWPGVETLFLSRLVGVAPEDVSIGMKVKAKFKRLSQFKPTDVYFVPTSE
ncbi:MAG: OB-fold domain-containing protein [Desulfitobacteriaceae bacterium]|nr:OB-fold domain-containing protein [Desulfitobacteriaceae bacterium]